MALPAQDDFNRADATGLGPNWSPVINDFRVISNGADGNATGAGADNLVSWSADSFQADHYAQVTVVTTNDGGPTVRTSGTSRATSRAYILDAQASPSVQKCVLGTFTTLGSPSAYANGDVAKIVGTGTTIAAFKNGIAAGSFVDASNTTGSPGLYQFAQGGRYDDFFAWDVNPILLPGAGPAIAAQQRRG